MRGKNKNWIMMTAIFIVILAIPIMNVPIASAPLPPLNQVSVFNPLNGSSTFGPINPVPPGNPPPCFSADINLSRATGVRAFHLLLSWDQKVLRLGTPPVVEGPFLPSGGETYFVYSIGVAGESIDIADLIMADDWADTATSARLVRVYFEVIGGGKTDLTLSAQLYDRYFKPKPTTSKNGYFWNQYPYIAFTWYVPTDQGPWLETFPVYGHTKEYEAYTADRPLITEPNVPMPGVEGGTMFYGDLIFFNASQSYDLDNDGNLVDPGTLSFHWVIREGGTDVMTYVSTIPMGNSGKFLSIKRGPYVTRFESDWEGYPNKEDIPGWGYGSKRDATDNLVNNTLDHGPVISWIPPFRRRVYGAALGWTELYLTITDSDEHEATYFNWIRIYRLSPGKTVMDNLADPNHSLSKDGPTMDFGGKIQNRGGTGSWPYPTLAAYMELARMIHGNMWGRVRFTILDRTGKEPIDVIYTPAIWLLPTENEVTPLYATWTIPENVAMGIHFFKTRAFYCNAGFAFGTGWGPTAAVSLGLAASGSILSNFKILE